MIYFIISGIMKQTVIIFLIIFICSSACDVFAVEYLDIKTTQDTSYLPFRLNQVDGMGTNHLAIPVTRKIHLFDDKPNIN